MSKKKATILDVARMANVSQGTVTRYFQNKQLKESNRVRIEEAIRTLDYKINYVARSLRSDKTYLVGILVTILNEFTGGIIRGIEEYLHQFGYGVIICCSNLDPKIEAEKLQFYMDKRIDGLIIIPSVGMKENIDQLEYMRREGMPIVSIDNYIEGFDCDTIMVENAQSIFNATELLIERGHTRIGLIYGDNFYSTSSERKSGYESALKKHGIKLSLEYMFGAEGYFMSSGFAAMEKFMGLPEPPTAVIAINYDITVGVLTFINQHHVSVPGDIAVIGYDADMMCRIFSPNISVITQPLYDIGLHAARCVYDRIKGDNAPFLHECLPTSIEITESINKINN